MSPLVATLLAGLAGYRLYRLWAVDEHPWIADARRAVVAATERRLGSRWASGWTCGWCVGTLLTVTVVVLVDVTVGVAAPWLVALSAAAVCGWLDEVVPR